MGIKIMRTPHRVMVCYAIIIFAGILAAQHGRIVGKVNQGTVPEGGARAANV